MARDPSTGPGYKPPPRPMPRLEPGPSAAVRKKGEQTRTVPLSPDEPAAGVVFLPGGKSAPLYKTPKPTKGITDPLKFAAEQAATKAAVGAYRYNPILNKGAHVLAEATGVQPVVDATMKGHYASAAAQAALFASPGKVFSGVEDLVRAARAGALPAQRLFHAVKEGSTLADAARASAEVAREAPQAKVGATSKARRALDRSPTRAAIHAEIDASLPPAAAQRVKHELDAAAVAHGGKKPAAAATYYDALHTQIREPVRVPRTVEQARVRLAELQARQQTFDDAVAARMMNPNAKLDKAQIEEQLARNTDSGKIKQARTGLTKAGKVKGSSSKFTGMNPPPTVNAEMRLQAEREIARMIDRLPADDPAVKQYRAERAEILDLQAALNPLPGDEIDTSKLGFAEHVPPPEPDRASEIDAEHGSGPPASPPPPAPPSDLPPDLPPRAAGDLGDPYNARTLTAGTLEQQIPRARSHITQAGERMVDRASRSLDTPFVRKIHGVRLVTATERAVKGAGRSQRQEVHRRVSAVDAEMKVLADVKENSPEDVAHFWYAQLPKSHQNAEGLHLVREQQRSHLGYITSGKAKLDMDARERFVKAQLAEAETGSQAGHAMRELEEIKQLRSDLPNRVESIGASIAQLDDLVAHPPPVKSEILGAMRKLMEDRTRILVDSGRLDPERASNRLNLVPNWLGLESDGGEMYVGHRAALPDSVGSFAPSSGGTGRVASPRGLSENKLVLANNGRVRASTRVAAEDWHAAQVFKQANVARDDLGKIGSVFTGHVPKDHALVNPKGRTVPVHWKTDELAQFSEDANDIADLRVKAKEIVDGFVGTDASAFERILQDAADNGVKWNELRVVPNRLVDRYYKQFRSFRGRSTPGAIYDMAIDGVATSIVFARIGYIPKNVVQNLVMAVPHQGVFLLPNAVRAGQVLADPKLRALLRSEVAGTGPTGALQREAVSKKALGAAAAFATKYADDPIRIAAFLHEAAAEGVISRYGFKLGSADRKKLIRLLTDRRQRARLNDVRSRSVDAMADFSRMTPDQARYARRILIIPGWLLAGSRYPFHFAATHPIRSALLAYVAMGEPGAPPELHFNNSIDTYFHGSRYLSGIDTPWGRERTSSLNPVTTPWDLLHAAVGSIRGKTSPFDYTTPTAFDEAQPLIAAAVGLARGEGAKRSLRPLAPNLGLLTGIAHPQASAHYPGDATRLGRLRREIGVLPVSVVDSTGKTSSRRKGTTKPPGIGTSRNPPGFSGGGGSKPPGFG